MVDQSSPSKVFSGASWGQLIPDDPLPPVPDIYADAKAPRRNLLAAFEEKKPKPSDLSEFEKSILRQYSVVDAPGGVQNIYARDDKSRPLMQIYNDAVYVRSDMAIGSKEDIDALLKAAVVAKAVMGDRGCDAEAQDEKDRLIMCKCAEMAGLKVNHPPEKSLDEVDPALAAQVESQWAQMKDQYQNTLSSKFTPTAQGNPSVTTIAAAPPEKPSPAMGWAVPH
jgi:hypothetical protein